MRNRGACLLPLLMLAGCRLGPNYRRPSLPVPGQYRGAVGQPTEASLADTKWPELFQDDTLKQLMADALEHNLDLALAADASPRSATGFASPAPTNILFSTRPASSTPRGIR